MSFVEFSSERALSGSFVGGFQSASGFSASASSGGQVSQIAQDLLQFSQSSSSAGAFGGASASFSASGASASFGSSGAAASAAAAGGAAYASQIEAAILAAQGAPININETEEITVLGNRGIWANKAEVVNWKGVIPIEQYVINEDANPEVITKRVTQQLEYIQELAIRYLRPPTPPAPGEIVIKQEGNTVTPPAPPLVIRQVPARAATPEPLVVREAPPQAPKPVGPKVITIGGKRLPPPPRKVVIERLAPLPSKPQSVIIERWLPYTQGKRRVIFQKAQGSDPVTVKPRNVVVQWEAPSVVIKKEYKYLGVIRANPAEYVSQYGASLKLSADLPQFVLDIKTPEGLVLAANHKYSSFYELEGDVQALKLVDLDKEGLSEYKEYLAKLFSGASASGSASASSAAEASAAFAGLLEKVFYSVDVSKTNTISSSDVSVVISRLNQLLGRQYSDADARAFYSALDVDGSGEVSLATFKRVFLRLANLA